VIFFLQTDKYSEKIKSLEALCEGYRLQINHFKTDLHIIEQELEAKSNIWADEKMVLLNKLQEKDEENKKLKAEIEEISVLNKSL